MDRTERGLRPVPAGPAPAAGDAADRGPDDALFAELTQVERTEDLPRKWLALQCQLTRGCRRGLLLLGPPDRGPFSVAACWPEGDPVGARPLQSAAEQALLKRVGFARAAAVPTEAAVLAEPVHLGGALHGAAVLEVAPRSDPELEELRAQLRLGFGWLDSFVQRHRVQGEGRRTERLEVVLGLLAAALEHERFEGAATTFATELAGELGCDRVSVGFRSRNRVRVRALSHSAEFGKRTNLIRAVEAAMDEAIDQSATVVFPTPGVEVPRAAHAHTELARQFGAQHICSVPFQRGGRTCGALTLERSQAFDSRTVVLLEVVGALAGPVLEDLRREDRLVVVKAGDALRGLLAKIFGPRHVALKLIASAIAAVVLVLTFATGGFRVTADVILEPAVKRAAVAPFEGYIVGAPARAGDVVQQGALLASLDDRDLQLERVRWESERGQALKQYRQALAERDAAQVEILAATVEEARAELARIEDRLTRTDIVAPFDGVVVTGDLTQRLGAPVQRGEVLFEVAPLDAYRIYLMVNETDISHVEIGQGGSMVLSSLPSESFRFRVEKITPVANAEEGRNTFRVEARIEDASPRLRPGIQGVAKVEVGSSRLIWIWTHDAIDWLRLKLWAWMP